MSFDPAVVAQDITDRIDALTAGNNIPTRLETWTEVAEALHFAGGGVDHKDSCRALSSANIALTGLQTIDGVSLIDGNRILVTGQTSAQNNGIWIVHPGAWTRAEDANVTGELTAGASLFIEEGTVYANTGWLLASPDPITIGTTPQAWLQVAGSAAGTAGAGLYASGSQLNVGANADGSIVVNPDDIRVGVLATDAQHGVRGGATQHAAATTLVNGFMSAADKTKLDGLPASAVPTTRTLTAGTGLTGGGDLSIDRTFNVVANADGSIIANADDVQVGVLATDAQHGVRGGGTQHAVATTSVAGFESAADKTNLDALSSSVALWPALTARYFAVDYDGGLDTNLGYSDVSLAAAGAVAIKTLEHLRQIFPLDGNGKVAVIAVKARAGGANYRNIANTADDDFYLIGVHGYFQLVIRGTGTVASAGAVAFANDTADKICCGARIVAGTNAPGYNPTGAPTTSVIDCVLAGGGAPGLTAEPALIGKRIRFDSATTTVALRNVARMIWQNTTSVITVSSNLPAVPVGTDVFYIEEPGVAVNRVVLHSANPTNTNVFAQSGIQCVGFRATSAAAPCITARGAAALVNFSFMDAPNDSGFSTVSCAGIVDLRFTNTYTDEVLLVANTITAGTGVRCAGGMTLSTCGIATVNHSANIAARFQILAVGQYSIGGGSYSGLGALIQGGGPGIPVTNLGGNIIGNQGSSTVRRLRTVSTFTESIGVSRSNVTIFGVDITGVGATPCININGVGQSVAIHDVVGSTGNTGVGLSLTSARDCHVLMGTLAANTFVGAAGQDVQGAGPVFYVHADYARTDLRDANGNHIQGSAGSLVGVTNIMANNAVANIGQYKITRATASGLVQAALATTAAGAAGIVGVSQSAFTTVQSAMHVSAGATWVQFDAAPTAGNIAYLSIATAGNAQDAAPAVSLVNRKIRLGRIARVSGTLGLVLWVPESLSVLADGAA